MRYLDKMDQEQALYRLENTIMPYAWGSRHAIAELQGRPEAPTPEAEMWMGAHPKASSSVLEQTGNVTPLINLIAANPERWLGSAVKDGRFPFLFKVLAADTPLSLQSHPTIEQAIEGYQREEDAGVPIDAPHRNYKDQNHKPELLCALTEFQALCGFKPVEESQRLFEALGLHSAGPESFTPVLAPLFAVGSESSEEQVSTALRETFSRLMTASKEQQTQWTEAVVQACEQTTLVPSEAFRRSISWALRLSDIYTGDVGVVLSLMLNILELAPGEAIYLDAGVLHAYLSGTGVELMANSDNVLRGGLTPKHVDVPELLRVLRFRASKTSKVSTSSPKPGVDIYHTPAQEFELSRILVERGKACSLGATPSAEIYLITEGGVKLELPGSQLQLFQGQSAVVPVHTLPLVLSGDGVAYRAALPSS